MHDAVIVSAVRTAAGKAPNGALRGTRPDELAATVIGEALRRAPGIDPGEIEDVILGCAMPEAEHDAADAAEGFRRLIHHLRVHRAAVLRVWMCEHDGRAQIRRSWC